MHPAVGLAIAYFCGSIPAAYVAGRAKGVDLRKHGSGNLGATNVVRVLGPKIGALVFAVDVAKGALPVALLPKFVSAPRPDLWAIAFGLAAIVGHVRPIFLLGRGGGKGVATASGVFFALAPIATLASLILFAAVLSLTGYVSLASLSGAVVLPVALAITRGPASPVFLISTFVAAFVFWTHRANIGRLRRGEEHRFATRRTTNDAANAPSPHGVDPPLTVGSDRRVRRRLDDHERRREPREGR